jgi:hypothetical protein
MTFLRFLPTLACVAMFSSLTSCQFGGGHVEAVNPTVTQLDALDVQWGLTPRKSRGGPRRTFQFVEPSPGSAAPASNAPASAAPADAAVPARESVRGAPPVSLNPEPPASAPVVAPASLR